MSASTPAAIRLRGVLNLGHLMLKQHRDPTDIARWLAARNTTLLREHGADYLAALQPARQPREREVLCRRCLRRRTWTTDAVCGRCREDDEQAVA